MHIAKVETLTELRQDDAGPGSSLSTGTVEHRSGSVCGKSGTYAKVSAPWLLPGAEVSGGLKVCSAEYPRSFEHDPASVSPEGSCRLVVLERGAQWPEWLAQRLSGGVTTYLVAEAVGDGLGGLVQRIEKRAQHCDMPVSQLVWLTAQSKRLAPLRWIKRLSARVQAFETLVIVPATTSAHALRYGARRHSRSSVWPRAVVA